MGRKKKKRTQDEAVIWCYYCDRIFKDQATLITHQKAKHFRCSACNKKMNTAQGLQVHCDQVHKISVKTVPGAKAGRESMDIEVFGMAGVPEGMGPGGVFDEPQNPAKKLAVEGSSGEAAFVGNVAPSVHPPLPAVPPVSQTHYAVPPQIPAQPPIYGASQYGAYYPPPGPHGPPMGPPQPAMLPQQIRLPPPGASLPQYPPPAGIPPMPPHPAPPGVSADGMPHPMLPGSMPPLLHPGPPRPGIVPLGQGPPAAINPPVGGALFPIVPSPAMPRPQGGGPQPPLPLDTPKSTVPLPAPELELIWKDEEYSMEERRAQLPKYSNPNAALLGIRR